MTELERLRGKFLLGHVAILKRSKGVKSVSGTVVGYVKKPPAYRVVRVDDCRLETWLASSTRKPTAKEAKLHDKAMRARTAGAL